MKTLKKLIGFSSVMLLAVFLITACSKDADIIREEPGKIVVSEKLITFVSTAAEKELTLNSNISADDLTFEIPENAKSWCNVRVEGNKIYLSVKECGLITQRSTVLTIIGMGIRQIIDIEQRGLSIDIPDDIQLFASKIEVTSENENLVEDEEGNLVPGPGHEIGLYAIDGKINTHHNSKYGEIKDWPFIYEIGFDTPQEVIDYIRLVPRQDAGNGWGAFGEFEVYVSTSEKAEFTKVGKYDAGKKTKLPFVVEPEKALKNVKAIRIEVLSALSNRVSVAEIEFYKRRDFGIASIFTDVSCSELISTVKQADIDRMPESFYKVMADAMLNKTYDNTGFRIQKYRPWQNPDIKGDENWTEYYSVRDNPTGIYVKAGEELKVFVAPTDRALYLTVEELKIESTDAYGPEKTREYKLNSGTNIITSVNPGLVYIKYLVPESLALIPVTASEKKAVEDLSVTINIFGGNVNGYYDRQKHNLADWKRVLGYESGSKNLDVLGRKIHLAWVKEDFMKIKESGPNEILQLWDTILVLEHKLMGLQKYNDKGGLIAKEGGSDRTFRNRMFVHIHPGNPAATKYRIHFSRGNYAELFNDPAALLKRIWGPAHEMGHINQQRPGMNWGGVIEVTNNIYCLYIQEVLGEPTMLTADGWYTKARADLIDIDQTTTVKPHAAATQAYHKLVPFWQLYLFEKVNGNPEFYMDLIENYRKLGLKVPGADPNGKNSPNRDHGRLQAEFARQACIAAKRNYIQFFKDWGFLRVSDVVINEYSDRHIFITKAMIDEIEKDIESKGYPKPKKDVTFITDSNQNDFKE